MNAQDLLIRLTERQIDSLFRAARLLPQDRLDWQPAPGARSALDQLQEVATALDQFWPMFTDRRIEWSEESFGKWSEERSKLTTLDALEQRARETHARLYDFIRASNPAEYHAPVELPFPGDYTVADVLAYAYWNAAYHEGQITYIASLLGTPSSEDGSSTQA